MEGKLWSASLSLKTKVAGLSLLRPSREGDADEQIGMKWSALEKDKNDIRMCMRFSHSGRWPGVREVPGSHDSG